ncbi:MAG: Do family serine endopeptidase [Tenuifilaceae bacterium]|jgi:Do/DeqQ family serine protease|nr:Do family serine endopeptidase [Tenuifilaceae bacterium]
MKTNRFFTPLLFSIIGGLVVFFSTQYLDKQSTVIKHIPVSVHDTMPVSMAAFATSTGEITDFTFAAERTIHGVVHVKTKAMRSQPDYSFGNPFYDFFFGPRQRDSQPVMGSGSGVIISNDGYIITNNHVIDKADNIEVVLNDKRTFDAKVIGRDPSTDLAVIKVEASSLPFVPFGNSENLKVGEWVLAVGNPFNLNSTVTAGIVSAKARNINILSNQYAIESFIQTDAAVNPGNSGGALVNLKGELVGINTAIASQTGNFAGYSFAVPTSIAQKVALDIIEFGEVQRALLGVSISEITPKLAEEKKIKDLKGVYIAGVSEGGAAEAVGLKEGDIILEVNGIEVNSPNQLQEQISKFRPKDKVEILVNRSNKKKQYEVVLRNMRGGFEVVKSDEIVDVLGAELKEIDANLMRRLGIRNGLQVIKLKDGKLKEQGVKEGFIITRVNRTSVTTVQELYQSLSTLSGGVLIEGVYPNGLVAYYAIGI